MGSGTSGELKDSLYFWYKQRGQVSAEGTFSYYVFPLEHWRLLRTNNPLERINREIRRRTRVVGNFPDGQSALMLVAARLRHIASTKWGTRAYVDMEHLYAMERDQEEKALELPMSV